MNSSNNDPKNRNGALRQTVLFLSCAFVFVGCGPTTPQLRATAANEMNCPVSELTLEHIDSKSMAVIGCGRERIYMKYCDKTAEGKSCGWRAKEEDSSAQ